MIDQQIWKTVPWEVMCFAYGIVAANVKVFDDKAVRKHYRRALITPMIEGSKMAKGSRNATAPQRSNDFVPVKWVNYNVTDEDITRLDEWQPDDGGLLAAIINIVDTGHSVTVKPTPDGSGFMAAATGVHDDCANKGLGLSGYSDTVRNAFKVLVYKHVAIFESVWPRDTAASRGKYR